MRYISKRDACERYGCSRPTLTKALDDMEASGRYPEGAIIHGDRNGKKTKVLDVALHDYMTHWGRISNGIKVAAYDPSWEQRQLNILGF